MVPLSALHERSDGDRNADERPHGTSAEYTEPLVLRRLKVHASLQMWCGLTGVHVDPHPIRRYG